MSKSTLTIREAVTVSAICFGLFIFWSTQAVLGGFPEAKFTDAGNVWMVIVEAILALTALLYLRARRFDVQLLTLRPDIGGTLLGLALFAATWLMGIVVTTPFVSDGQASSVAEFSFSGVSLGATILLAMVNGAFEEVFLLVVLVRGLRGYGFSIAVGLPLLVRLLYHLYQGPLGVVWILAFGLAAALFYIRSGRLWPVVFAHMLWDIVPVVLSKT
ncbi:CPBP family intramembrane glutamic endopeptidase [Roseateles flavus]|uniref:CPBP family intramembrane glutamic endopeptidase n=1 Tax=Roseateles flavus TaxID=3149041 RepID=A0ABV0GAS4_9BURK